MMKISVIIPVYNEEKTLLEILKKVQKVPLNKEVIIIDDGSTDKTREILMKIKEKNVKILFHPKNVGKGGAIRTGIKEAKGDIIIIQDADLEYEPNDYCALIQPIVEDKSGVVYGSRELGRNKKSSLGFFWGGKLLSCMSNILYNAKITDEPTCYKVFKKEILKSLNLRCRGFEFCPEVTAKLRKKGFKIYEVPIHYFPRSIREGKKIRLRDGIVAIWTLFKYRFHN